MILNKVADFVTELLDFDPTKVIIGRENATQETFSNNYIVIDILTPTNLISTSRKYNGESEIETIENCYKGVFTLEFYGSEAYSNLQKFLALQNTQKGRDLEKKYAITTFKGNNINNLKQIAGNRYYERYEVEVTIQFYEVLEVETLRIDEIVLDEILNNE